MTILFLILLLLVVIFWLESLKLREYVIARSKQVCREANLQLLDQTVALISISIKRSSTGKFHLYRKYQFEVSENGADRYAGYVELFGRAITSIRFDGPNGENVFHQSNQRQIH